MESIKLLTDEVIYEMGKRIQDERRKKGYKAIDFADMIGIGKDQLSRIENGKVVCKLEYLYTITQFLQVSMDYLMFGEQEKEEEEEEEEDDNIIYLPDTISGKVKNKIRKIVDMLVED